MTQLLIQTGYSLQTMQNLLYILIIGRTCNEFIYAACKADPSVKSLQEFYSGLSYFVIRVAPVSLIPRCTDFPQCKVKGRRHATSPATCSRLCPVRFLKVRKVAEMAT